MSRKKRNIYKKKSSSIKNLENKILQIFNQNANKILNYKQVAGRLEIDDSNGRNQIIRKLSELKNQGRLEETSPGKFVIKDRSGFHKHPLNADFHNLLRAETKIQVHHHQSRLTSNYNFLPPIAECLNI